MNQLFVMPESSLGERRMAALSSMLTVAICYKGSSIISEKLKITKQLVMSCMRNADFTYRSTPIYSNIDDIALL